MTTDAFKKEVFAQQTGEAYLTLITITHPELEQPIRITDDGLEVIEGTVRGVQSRGEDFIYLPFELVAPGQEKDRSPTGSLKVDNVSREIILAIRQISSAPDVLIEVVMASTPSEVEAAIDGFKLTNIRADSLTVEGELTITPFDMEPFPSGTFTPGGFPGIF